MSTTVLYQELRTRVAAVWPEVNLPATDPARVRGIARAEKIATVDFSQFETPYAIIHLPALTRLEKDTPMEGTDWKGEVEIYYVKSPDQTVEQVNDQLEALRAYLEDPTHDLPDSLGQIYHTKEASWSRYLPINREFIEREYEERAGAITVCLWLWN